MKNNYIDSVLSCLHDKLKVHDSCTDLLTHALKILETHDWEKTDDPSICYKAIQFLA